MKKQNKPRRRAEVVLVTGALSGSGAAAREPARQI